jgi:enoyl-CoA hydratase
MVGPESELHALCGRICSVPRNELMMQKMVINQAIENMALASTQTLATFFTDAPQTRHSHEGMWFSLARRGGEFCGGRQGT